MSGEPNAGLAARREQTAWLDASLTDALRLARPMVLARFPAWSALPGLTTPQDAGERRVAGIAAGAAARVAFAPAVRRAMRDAMPHARPATVDADLQFRERLGPEATLCVHVEKVNGFGLGKMFGLSLWLEAGDTAAHGGHRATAPDDGIARSRPVSVAELFGAGDATCWAYGTTEELASAAAAVAEVVGLTLPAFRDRFAHARGGAPLPEGGGALTARSALACIAEAAPWLRDAACLRVFRTEVRLGLRVDRTFDGTLDVHEAWTFQLRGTASEGQWVRCRVPHSGSITILPHERPVTTFGDSFLPADWMDSDAAARLACAQLPAQPVWSLARMRLADLRRTDGEGVRWEVVCRALAEPGMPMGRAEVGAVHGSVTCELRGAAGP